MSRLDACEDYSGPGTWDKLEALVTEVCSLHKVTMAPFGEGHIRPDGTRDATKGRSWYCGSKNSPFRIVIYEKGLEQIAKGIPDDPTRVRLSPYPAQLEVKRVRGICGIDADRPFRYVPMGG